MSQIRVVVTGIGATTPLGGNAASTWEGLLAGRSGVSRIEADWVDELPVTIYRECEATGIAQAREMLR